MDYQVYWRLKDHRKAKGPEMIKYIDLVISLIRTDEARLNDLGTKIVEAYLKIASTEIVW